MAVEAADELNKSGTKTRVVSMPSWELFDEQDKSYQDSVLPPDVTARVSVEAGSTFGWSKCAHFSHALSCIFITLQHKLSACWAQCTACVCPANPMRARRVTAMVSGRALLPIKFGGSMSFGFAQLRTHSRSWGAVLLEGTSGLLLFPDFPACWVDSWSTVPFEWQEILLDCIIELFAALVLMT